MSKHFRDKDAAHIHTQEMACHRDILICLQTFLLTILP